MERPSSVGTGKLVASAVIPLVILGAMIAFLLWPGNSFLNFGTPLPDVTVERLEFGEKLIIAHIRNTGPETVDIAMADVNDRIRPAAIEPSKTLERYGAARVVIPYDWNEGQPYEIGITTSDGTRFAGSVQAATMTPRPDAGQVSLLALLGTYVGIIPVMIGLLWLPFLRQLSQGKYMFFMSLTAGLLLFLGIDAVVEANEVSAETVAGSLGGVVLIATVTVVSFLALLYVSERLVEGKSKTAIVGASSVALMIAVGIGLHNLGEGLAIGGAMVAGEVALSTFLIVGFTLHNTTEGLAIVAPVARQKPRIAFLALLGFIAGAPAIAGAWIGGFIASPIASVVFLAIGAGAVFQVVYAIFKFAGGKEKFLSGPVVAGIATGMLLMYLTTLLI
ncbi:ZIP family metal transporter [Nitrososphaera sp.]|uniref:ZIP family metal transporter n=1 Tax=Nitrososphaera sp. TaxID=1971748 RepID=UPI002ED9B5F0